MSDKHTCTFCQKDTVYVPLIIKGGNGDKSYHKFDVHYCYDCAAEYAHFGNIDNIHLYATINNRMYRWSMDSNKNAGYLWHVGKPGEPGVRPNREMTLVRKFKDVYPDITPQNIVEKLRFLLLFL